MIGDNHDTSSGDSDSDEAHVDTHKTPMSLLNELVRYNKMSHLYQQVSKEGPAHACVFTVSLRLGDEDDERSEVFTGSGSKIRNAQHAAAAAALRSTSFRQLPAKKKKSPSKTQHANAEKTSAPELIPPTVELNALAMKRCEAVKYTLISTYGSYEPRSKASASHHEQGVWPRKLFVMMVTVGDRSYYAQAYSFESARHAAASEALSHIKLLPTPVKRQDLGDDDEATNGKKKSPVSVVYELVRKHGLSVSFELIDAPGPAHLRRFVTQCRVGDLLCCVAEASTKKLSKQLVADGMLLELKQLIPEPTTAKSASKKKRKKKKAKSTIKPESCNVEKVPSNGSLVSLSNGREYTNAVSFLFHFCQLQNAPRPVFDLVKTRNDGRRKEFVMTVTVTIFDNSKGVTREESAEGCGPSKRLAKREAATAMLVRLGLIDKVSITNSKSILRKNAQQSGDGDAKASGEVAGKRVTFKTQRASANTKN